MQHANAPNVAAKFKIFRPAGESSIKGRGLLDQDMFTYLRYAMATFCFAASLALWFYSVTHSEPRRAVHDSFGDYRRDGRRWAD